MNASLYAVFEKHVADKIHNIIEAVGNRFSFADVEYPMKDVPHLSIIVGPEVEVEKKDVAHLDSETFVRDAKEVARTLYKDINSYPTCTVKFTGVSNFKRENGYIIKLDFESKELTELTMKCRDQYPEINKKYLSEHVTDNDLSRGYPPCRWLHTTICVVKNVDKVPEVELFIRELALNYIHKPMMEKYSVPLDVKVDHYEVVIPGKSFIEFSQATGKYELTHAREYYFKVPNYELVNCINFGTYEDAMLDISLEK